MKHELVITMILAMGLLAARTASGSQGGVDYQKWLRQPGVKLVVVEFYGEYCGPCKAAVPTWKRLHEAYFGKGLRLIVVVVGEGGYCGNPGWNPDEVVCDLDSSIYNAWRGSIGLPQAFLYSWQGNLLASHADVGTVARKVEAYFREVPRILVADPTDRKGRPVREAREIKELIRSELRRSSKFEVLATEKERRALRELQRKSHGLAYSESGQCEPGQEVSANSKLEVKLMSYGGKRALLVQLFSAEKGCMVSSGKAPILGKDMEKAVIGAVAMLVEGMIGKGKNRPEGPRSGREAVVPYQPPSGEYVVVPLESEPSGAKVMLNGVKVCASTPCRGEVAAGRAVFQFLLERYEPTTKEVAVARGMKPVKAVLAPTFGWLSVLSEPPGVAVKVNGRERGATPWRAASRGNGAMVLSR